MTLQYHKYRLPLKSPLQTSQQTFDHREGIIMEYSTGDFACYGDTAPLPGYSDETLENIQEIISSLKNSISAKLRTENPVEALQNFYEDEDLSAASLQFGLDSLAYQIRAHNAGQTLQQYLFPKAKTTIPVNALGTLQTEQYLENTNTQIADGFRTIKFKVGIDFAMEFDRLQDIRSQFPDLNIRLDANQAWSTEEALRYCQQLKPLDIEYCEEPLKEPIPENFELLSRHTNLSLALDESLYHVSFWPNLLPYTSYLILKPMLLGSFTKIFETKRLADTHDNKTVFTTSLESGIGRMITATLASGKGSTEIAHGLATGHLLDRDVFPDSRYISDGMYHISSLHQSKIEPQKLHDVSSSLFQNRE